MGISFASFVFRIIVGFAFFLSFLGKARDISSFKHTMVGFGFFSEGTSKFLIFPVLAGELMVAMAMASGGIFLRPGFLLAVFMLLVFSLALALVLARGINTTCNCFGPSNAPISLFEIIRNAGFILFALGGYGTSVSSVTSMPTAAYGLAGISACIFTLIWINLNVVVTLFRESF